MYTETETVTLMARLSNALMIRTQDYERSTGIRAVGSRELLNDALVYVERHRPIGQPHPLSALRSWLSTSTQPEG